MTFPEDQARQNIDQTLAKSGWAVRDQGDAHISAYRGLAIRNFTLKREHGFADYLLYVDGRAAGVVEAKKEGDTLTGVEIQSDKYTKGLPDELPAWSKLIPFSYESTGIETRFTNGLDPRRKGPSPGAQPRRGTPPGRQLFPAGLGFQPAPDRPQETGSQGT